MAKLPNKYNPEDHEPLGSFDVIPAGWYPVKIESDEIKQTRAGDGLILQTRYTVTEGEFVGASVFGNINLENPSEKAVEIGMRELRSLCDAVGWRKPLSDTKVLLGKRLMLKVGLQEADTLPSGREVPARNDVKGYKAIDATVPAPAPVADEDDEDDQLPGVPAPGKKKAAAKKPPTLEELAALADEGDQDAADKISEVAAEQDIDPDEYATWAEVVAELETGEEEETESDDPDWA